MGEWTVLSRRFGNGRDGGHVENDTCRRAERNSGPSTCYPVVKEHQSVPEADVVAPEFTIAVSYQPEVLDGPPHLMGHPSTRRGWKWSICWTGEDGGRKMRTGYGFPTPEKAKEAAESKAQQIALASLPEEVYTYRPTL